MDCVTFRVAPRTQEFGKFSQSVEGNSQTVLLRRKIVNVAYATCLYFVFYMRSKCEKYSVNVRNVSYRL